MVIWTSEKLRQVGSLIVFFQLDRNKHDVSIEILLYYQE